MRKLLPVFLMAIIQIYICQKALSFPFINIENPLYPALRSQIIAQASSVMGREVEIGSASGNLVGSIVLKDIRIAKGKKLSGGEIISVKKATIHYNLIKAAAKKDILPAISRIDIDGADVYVEHEKDGSWNLAKLISAGGKGGQPPAFAAKIYISDSKAEFVDNRGFFPEPVKKTFKIFISSLNGIVDLSKKEAVKYSFSGLSGKFAFKSDGKIDLKKPSAEIAVKASGLEIKDWNEYIAIPVVKNADLSGRADIDLNAVLGKTNSLKGSISLDNAAVYNRPASGRMELDLQGNKIALKFERMNICRGSISGNVDITASANGLINGGFNLSGVDLGVLSNNMPGVHGKASGAVTLSGPLKNIRLACDASVLNGAVLGGSFNRILADSRIKDGGVEVSSASVYSGQTQLLLKGSLQKDLSFAFEAQAKGFRLASSDIYKGASGTLEKFEGSISGKLNRDFFEHPLGSMAADGALVITDAVVSGQPVSRAAGEVKLNNGVLSLSSLEVSSGSSMLVADGYLGFGKPSSFYIKSDHLDLKDIKIIDRLLPEESSNAKGSINFLLKANGSLPTILSGDPAFLLANLNVDLRADLGSATIGDENINSALFDAAWLDKKLTLNGFQIISPKGNVDAYGTMASDNSLDFSFSAGGNLHGLKTLSPVFSRINGTALIKGKLSGSLSDPSAEVDFDLTSPSFGAISFEEVKGRLDYLSGTLSFGWPLLVRSGGEEYNARISLDLSGDLPKYEGEVRSSKAGLSSALSIAREVMEEFGSRLASVKDQGPTVSLTNEKITSGMPEAVATSEAAVFTKGKTGILDKWAAETCNKCINVEENPLAHFSASAPMGLDINFFGEGSEVSAAGAVNIGKGQINGYKFDAISAEASFSNGKLNISLLKINRGPGFFYAHGSAGSQGPLHFRADADNFSVGGLDAVLGLGAGLEGNISLSAEVSGTFSDPSVSCSFDMKKAGLGLIFLDEAAGSILCSDRLLDIDRLEIKSGKQTATMKGKIPFDDMKDFDVKLNLDGGNIAEIFNIFKGIRWAGGKGAVSVTVTGKRRSPVINSSVKIYGAKINIDQIRTTLSRLDVDMDMKDDVLTINKLTGALTGNRTNGVTVPFSLAAAADLRSLFGEKREAGINILLADTAGSVYLPGIYNGSFALHGTRMKGVLSLDPKSEEKPLFTSGIDLYDGTVYLPKTGGASNQPFAVGLDVTAVLGRNMQLKQGEAAGPLSVDLSNMDIAIASEGLKISGTSAAPKIAGDVDISSGTLTILGRQFDILDERDQETYFGADRSMIVKNKAVFSAGEGSTSVLPNLSLSAKSEVEPLDTSGSGAVNTAVPAPKQKVIVITRISGIPSADEKTHPIKLQFFAFSRDDTKTPPAVTTAPYDDNQIRLMLLPDFLKGSLGLSKGSGVDVNAALVDALNTRIQETVLGGLNRKIGSALGLDSFTLNYNFGKDIERSLNMSSTSQDYSNNDTQQLGVSFAKGFFDRIYIQVRYAQAQGQPSTMNNNTMLNYQITYKLGYNYSLAYYREPVNFQDQNSTYYKLTLQSVYQF